MDASGASSACDVSGAAAYFAESLACEPPVVKVTSKQEEEKKLVDGLKNPSIVDPHGWAERHGRGA